MRVVSLVAVVLSATACVLTVGNGVPSTEVRSAEGATAFESRMWLHTTVRVGDASKIEVTCDENLMNDIITEVVDGVLVLRTEPDLGGVQTHVDCGAVVELPHYEHILNAGSGAMALEGDFDGLSDLWSTGSGAIVGDGAIAGLQHLLHSGSGAIELGEVASASLSVVQSGSGALSIGTLDAGVLEFDNTGSSSTTLSGGAGAVDIQLSGSGGFAGQELVVAEADVVLTASGSLSLTVTDRLFARLSGSGGATIYGDPPERDVNATGSGSVVFQ